MSKNGQLIKSFCLVLATFLIILIIYSVLMLIPPKLDGIDIADTLNEQGEKEIKIRLKTSINRPLFCALDKKDGEYQQAVNKVCTFKLTKDYEKIYIKYNKNKIIELNEMIKVSDIISIDIKNHQSYLALKDSFDVLPEIKAVGTPNKNLKWTSSNEAVATVVNGKVTGLTKGTTTITAEAINGVKSSFEVNVTDIIMANTLKGNKTKTKIPCNHYTKEEAALLDAILASIVKESGEKTRGAVVNVARFLPLQFKYRVPYFFENGRLQTKTPGKRIVDGEGRYYKKGLYLHESKKADITKIGWGPAIWGCGLTNWDTSYGWTRGAKYPNGLDCSGFVSWAFLNAGFDIGDIGSGISPEQEDLADYGKFQELTYEYANAKQYKVGDLIGRDGHIAIIAGIDDKNIYIAEALLAGTVIETFSYVDANSKLYKLYGHIVEMEEYYQAEGNYTNMW